MKPVIIIAGPTGSGKTDIAAEVVRLSGGGAIISADSRQVYRHLDIGTNKAGTWDAVRAVRVYHEIDQYLTDVIDPSATYSAGMFVESAIPLVRRIAADGRVPVVAGGTGLYLTALVDGLAPLPQGDPLVRSRLSADLAAAGIEALYERLAAVDPVSAEKNRSNPQRLLRAMEVYLLSGKPMSELHARQIQPDIPFIQFALDWPREELYRTIDQRASYMLAAGMVEETERVLDRGFSPGCPGLQGLGYKHIVQHIAGKMHYPVVEELFKRDTRRYAKRQLTWFRRDPRIRWIPVTAATYDPPVLAEKIIKIANNLV